MSRPIYEVQTVFCMARVQFFPATPPKLISLRGVFSEINATRSGVVLRIEVPKSSQAQLRFLFLRCFQKIDRFVHRNSGKPTYKKLEAAFE